MLTTHYEHNLNHLQWLETVPADLRRFVPATISWWDDRADEYNTWADLGWDERDALLREHAALANGCS